jgi:hypothetical protein
MSTVVALEVLEGHGGRKVKVFESIGSCVESSIATYDIEKGILLSC